jgi:hypothetical protein
VKPFCPHVNLAFGFLFCDAVSFLNPARELQRMLAVVLIDAAWRSGRHSAPQALPVEGARHSLTVAGVSCCPERRSLHPRYQSLRMIWRERGVIELTEKEKRFLKRVDTISHFPWSNKVSAVDAKGKSMRISRATFARLRDDGIIVRSASDLSSDTYVVNSSPVTPDVEEASV